MPKKITHQRLLWILPVLLILWVQIFSAVTSSGLYALSAEQKKVLDSGILYYDTKDYLICEGSTGTAISSVTVPTAQGGVEISDASNGNGKIVTEAELISRPFTMDTWGTIEPQAIVLHWTTSEYDNGQTVADTLSGRVEEGWPIGRSLQLSVDKAGKIWQLSETLETRPAQTFPGGAADPWNNNTIGIEIESGSFGEDIPAYEQDLINNTVQFNKVTNLVRGLMTEYGILNVKNNNDRTGVFGHLEINSGNSDPGPTYMANVRQSLGQTPVSSPNQDNQNTATSCRCVVPGSSADLSNGNRTFFIGDSLMNGMYYGNNPDGEDSLLNQASLAGLSVDVNPNETRNSSGGITRASGKSIESVGGENIDGMIEYLDQHTDDFSSANTDVIVVGLGTNYYGRDREAQIRDFIDYLRNYNPNAQIFWINTKFNVSDPSIKWQDINIQIDNVASEKNFTVIDYATAVSQSPTMGPPTTGSDQIHLTWAANIEKSTYVISQVTGEPSGNTPSSGSNTGCGGNKLPGDNNAEQAWNFFVDKIGPLHTAAAMGNFQQESRLQPEIVNSIGATGIAQWLGGRKQILMSRPEPLSLATQLQFAYDEFLGQNGASRQFIKVSSPISGSYEAWLETTDIATATEFFRRAFERPGEAEANDAKRIEYATDFLTLYGSI